ncbi:protein-disulfide reductase DsbD N-terminal domain-containing protein [Noviherbaspirillum sp. ST9]|uniref:protein-disulfide reductase DsbD N-terminal domain-containing protein n=1 Tax=Noviherbaspirillum sp. ST9 TaxID=3401606 RepID=UPI003B589753
MKKTFAIATLSILMLAQVSSTHAQQTNAPATNKGLASLFSSASEEELIEPDLAFQMKVTVKGPNTVVAELVPAKGYYLYKEKIRFAFKNGSGVLVNTVKLPSGEMKNDQIFGKTEVYRKAVPVEITMSRPANAGRVTLVAAYQGCHERLGVCYPPIEKAVNLVLP